MKPRILLPAAVFVAFVAFRDAGVWSYLLHRPGALDRRSASLLASHGLWPALIAAALWLLGLGLGRRALRAAGAPPEGALDGVTAAALGLGLLGQAVFLLGWAGALEPRSLSALLAIAAPLALTALPRTFRRPAPRLDAAGSLAAGALAFGAFHLLVAALAPPSEWDVRAYHLALPELYLRAGRLIEVPWIIQSHWPHLMELLYAVPLAAGRDGAAALLHAGACGLLAYGVFLAAGRGAAGMAAVLVLAGQPALLRGAPTAHADGACALYLFAAAAALARWREKRGDGWLAAAGLLAGLSASSKLFGAAGAASWTLWLLWRTRRAREAALFAACAAAVVGPWLLRTWLQAGDPFWPLLGLDRSAAELAARYKASNLWSWPPPAWLASHHGPAFLLAPLAGLAALGHGRRPAGGVERALWIPVPMLALLAARHHEAWRFLIPAYAAGALACGRLAEGAFAGGGGRRAAAAVLVAFGAAPLAALSQNNELFAVLGPRSQAAPQASPRALYEERTIDVAAFYRESRALLPPGAEVLLFREVRGYGSGFAYRWGDPLNQTQVDYRRLPDPAALGARLKALGVTHVLDHPGSHLYREDPAYYDARTLALMSECLKRYGRLVLAREGLALYELL